MALATPAVAQEGGFQTPTNGDGLPIPTYPMPVAPMPREKDQTRIVIEVVFGAAHGGGLKLTAVGEPAKPLCCIGDCCNGPSVGAAVASAAASQYAGCLNRLFATCDHCGGGMPPRALAALCPMGFGSAANGSGLCGMMPQPAYSVLRNFGTVCGPITPHPLYGHALIGNFGAYCGPVPHPFAMQQGTCIIRIGGQYPVQMVPPMPPPTFTCPVAPPAVAPQVWHSMPPAPRPQMGVVPHDTMKQMAADAFGDLLIQSGVAPCVPLPPQLLTVTTTPPKPGITGTWYRDVGPKRCVIQVLPDHMVLCVSESREVGGKPVTANLTFTMDYHLTRDNATAVGLITSVDMTFDGDMPEGELDGLLESFSEFRKALEDKPFAMTCRLYGDSLVIGNVRMPVWKENPEQPSAYISGRYTSAADKPLPKLKAIKAEPRLLNGMALPGPRYLEHYPQYFAPDPAFPLPRELASQEDPKGAARRAGYVIEVNCETATGVIRPALPGPVYPCTPPSANLPAQPTVRPYTEWQPTPTMPIPTEPVPSMTEPVPPGLPVSEAPRISVPTLGPLGLDLDVPLNTPPSEHTQLLNFSVGLFDGDDSGIAAASAAVQPMPVAPPAPTLQPLPPMVPGPLSFIVPPLGNGSFLRSVMNAHPDHRQLLNFGIGLFGSQ
jgi:hypothetical protein